MYTNIIIDDDESRNKVINCSQIKANINSWKSSLILIVTEIVEINKNSGETRKSKSILIIL